ncbi:hypothetical protein F4777DRAFT_578685 [Nemania sp. FL0916]|nr:hypothetical protein F4777DRAFT_578685 [Nemania sp. FL0916]
MSFKSFTLEFRLLNDGLETDAVQAMPLTAWHRANNPVFRRFSALPAELRLMIWDYFIAPRVVGMACVRNDIVSYESIWDSHSIIQPAVPVLLRINRETRALAVRHYELSFAWETPPLSILSHRTPALDSFLDAVYLVGDLEPLSYSSGGPMPSFLKLRKAGRVKKVAIAFSQLRVGEANNEEIFVTLFHLAGCFCPRGGEVFVCVTEQDEDTHALLGNETPLLSSGGGGISVGNGGPVPAVPATNADLVVAEEAKNLNIIQRFWRRWYRAWVVEEEEEEEEEGSLSDIRFVLIPEDELARRVYDFMLPPKPAQQNTNTELGMVESN